MAKSTTLVSLLTLGLPLFCMAAPTPKKPAPPAAPAANYQSCASYASYLLGTVYNPKPQDLATIYLDGALDELELDTPPSAAEAQKRDACVLMSLQHGADPNNKKTYTAPLLMAISDKDVTAARALLQYKADPNVQDEALAGRGQISALQRACGENGGEDIAIELIHAGADPVVGQPLWTAASSAEARAVAEMLKTKKIPVNQLSKFSDIDDDSETALDASEYRVHDLTQYFVKYNASSSVSDKIGAANDILYADYVVRPMLRSGSDPDAYLKDLLQDQKQVSDLLKAQGWTCHKPNCGIETLLDGDGTDSN